MIKRLVFLICGSAALAAISVFICQLAFPDMLPYAIDESAQQAWRRQAAFFVTTIGWLSAEVSMISGIALAVVLWKNRDAKVR
jgi:hypothetical protein